MSEPRSIATFAGIVAMIAMIIATRYRLHAVPISVLTYLVVRAVAWELGERRGLKREMDEKARQRDPL